MTAEAADPFSAHLGAVIEAVEPGYSRVSLVVTAEMTNFHGTTHGGVIFSLGDIAFAAASNAGDQRAVALNVSIVFLRATQVGDHLIAEARAQAVSRRTALYELTVTEAKSGQLVATSQALAYRRS
jgi:acyl-CoA thioesterase